MVEIKVMVYLSPAKTLKNSVSIKFRAASAYSIIDYRLYVRQQSIIVK